MAVLTGREFFPQLISGPFHHGLVIVFSMAIVLLVIAAGASLLRGGRYVHDEHSPGQDNAVGQHGGRKHRPGNTVAGNDGAAGSWPARRHPALAPATSPSR